jgi:hypothetical protein
MIRSEPVVGSSHEAPIAVPEPRRERVVVRRRRAHSRHRTGRWIAARSRRKILRAAVLCTTVLLLMAAGLYLGLSRQDVGPADRQVRGPAVALSGAHG